MKDTLQSRLMLGEVRHRRFAPLQHEFCSSLFMPALDLDEIDTLARTLFGFGTHWWHWARFKRSDYLGRGNLKQAVQDKVAELTGEQIKGRVVALCHLRYLGVYFSPVNFYFIYDDADKWRYLLAEVSNTPWNERHYYVISASSGDDKENWCHPKAFHVSPFNPIAQQYRWRIRPLGETVTLHLECHEQQKKFDATLTLKAQPMSRYVFIKLLLRTPCLTLKILAGIYWQAWKLWRKGAPLYTHPAKKPGLSDEAKPKHKGE